MSVYDLYEGLLIREIIETGGLLRLAVKLMQEASQSDM